MGALIAEETLRKIHGDEVCHICGKPKASQWKNTCSYPHGMVPVRAVDPEYPEGFWVWVDPEYPEGFRVWDVPKPKEAKMADGDNSDLKSMSTDDLKKLLHTLRHEEHPHKDAARRKAVHDELKTRGVTVPPEAPPAPEAPAS